MKKSKIFFGVGATLLAIAGIAATKANSKFTTYYYQSSTTPTNICSEISATCSTGTATCTEFVTAKDANYTIFQSRNSAGTTCLTPLKKS